MDVSKPYAALSPGVDVEVLVELSRSTEPRSGRALARRIGRSETGVRHALDQLVEQGIVLRSEAAPAYVFTLNREHLLAPIVEQLAGARLELINRLKDAISSWSAKPIHASIFGSAARGDGDTASDIDIFLVRPDDLDSEDPTWRDQIDRLSEAVLAWTGNHAGVIDVGESDLGTFVEEQRPVLGNIAEDAIDLAGKPVRRLLRGRS